MSELERIEDEHGAGAALGMLMAFVMMLCLGGCEQQTWHATTWPDVAALAVLGLFGLGLFHIGRRSL